jgi:hypothetical protein
MPYRKYPNRCQVFRGQPWQHLGVDVVIAERRRALDRVNTLRCPSLPRLIGPAVALVRRDVPPNPVGLRARAVAAHSRLPLECPPAA